MESEKPMTGPDRADASLRGYAQVRAKVEHRGPSRAFAVLQLWLAAALAAYLGAFLISVVGDPPNEVTAGAADYTSGLLVLPLLLLASLISGARERFSIRTKPSAAHWVAYTLIIGWFAVLLVASITEVTYPWWAALLLPVLLFVTMAAGPIRALSRPRTREAQPWSNEPLRRPARRTTVLIGLTAGLLAATSTQEKWFAVISTAACVVLVVVFLFGWRAEWGLSHTGYEWGPIHWAAFGIVLSGLFTLSVLLANTDWITPPISITAGVLALLVMAYAAFLPRNPGRA